MNNLALATERYWIENGVDTEKPEFKDMLELLKMSKEDSDHEELRKEFRQFKLSLNLGNDGEDIATSIAFLKEKMMYFVGELNRLTKKQSKTDMDCVEEIIEDVQKDRENNYNLDCVGLPTLHKASNGYQPGYYIFSGRANVGKTAIMQNISYNLLSANKDLICLYFSFDDLKINIIKRYISLQSAYMGLTNATPIYEVGFKQKDKAKYNTQIKAITGIKEHIGKSRLKVYDVTDMTGFDGVEEKIREYQRKDKKIIVCIDGLLNTEAPKSERTNFDKDEWRANITDYIANFYGIPVFTTHELKKTESKSIVTEDLKGSGKFGFNAKFVILLTPEDTTDEAKNKTVIANISKNKMSHIKGNQRVNFEAKFNYLQEIASGEYNF